MLFRGFITDPPMISVTPNSTSVIQGSEVTLYCKANANPRADYQWFKVCTHCFYHIKAHLYHFTIRSLISIRSIPNHCHCQLRQLQSLLIHIHGDGLRSLSRAGALSQSGYSSHHISDGVFVFFCVQCEYNCSHKIICKESLQIGIRICIHLHVCE